MLPLNMVIPATNRPAASVFFGATVVARRRTPECISCSRLSVQLMKDLNDED